MIKIKNKLRIITMCMISSTLLTPTLPINAETTATQTTDQTYVFLGKDLTKAEKTIVYEKLQLNPSETYPTVYVSNKEEHKALNGKVNKKQIGNKSMSSGTLKIMPENSGITITMSNITYCTEDMYKNALKTAGVKNAQISISAPYEISGTAALVGITKAYEKAKGTKLTEDQKETANDELATTQAIAKTIGKEKASSLIIQCQETVLNNKVTTDKDILKIIKEKEKKIDIKLSNAEEKNIIKLMKKMIKLEKNNVVTQTNKLDKSIKNHDIGSTIGNFFGVIKKTWISIFTSIHF